MAQRDAAAAAAPKLDWDFGNYQGALGGDDVDNNHDRGAFSADAGDIKRYGFEVKAPFVTTRIGVSNNPYSKGLNSTVTYTLTDTNGRPLYSKPHNLNENNVATEQLDTPPGKYIIELHFSHPYKGALNITHGKKGDPTAGKGNRGRL